MGKCLRRKIIGKPYSGKPNVRFDEGELEIEPFGYYASSLLYFGRMVVGSNLEGERNDTERLHTEI